MTSPPLQRYAWPLLPAEPEAGEVVELGDDWELVAPVGAGPVVCGRPPLRKVTPVRAAVKNLVRRNAFIRHCEREHARELRAIHLLPPPPGTSAPLLSTLRDRLLAGALVLLARDHGETALDRVARAAGAPSTPESFHAPGDGGAVARIVTEKGPRILRIARRGEPSDPAPVAEALDALERAGVDAVPRLDGRGTVGEVSWMTETLLPGSRPRSISTGVRAQLVGLVGRLPRSDGPPRAPDDDLDVVERHFPEQAASIAAIRRFLAARCASTPALGRHGDLWAGNVLTSGGRLTGVVDWAAWHPASVPGTDLLHLFVAGAKKQAGGELGDAWSTRPWRTQEFLAATASYWRALGLDPTPDFLDAVALAWWACWVAQSVTRHPGRAQQRSWVAGNVEKVLDEFAQSSSTS